MNETTNPHKRRTARDIARRSIAVHCVVAAAHGASSEDVGEWLKEEGLWDELTPRESRFLAQTEHPKIELAWMTWLVEAQVALLWSIGKLDSLAPLTGLCDTGSVVDAVPNLFETTVPFIEPATLRSAETIVREEQRVYDLHCRVNEAARKGDEVPDGLNKQVIFFRHYSLSWIVGYDGQAWDEVAPDT